MNHQAPLIKLEIKNFEEDINTYIDTYASDIKVETKAFDCHSMSNNVIFEAEPQLWAQAPIDILIDLNGEDNICILCGFVEGAPLTTDMRRKKSIHTKKCLNQTHFCLNCGFKKDGSSKTRIQKSLMKTHYESCLNNPQ